MTNNDDKPNYYALLCLDPKATKDDVKKAYRRQALLFHPDKMKPHMKEEASQHFQLISEAYEVLSDDAKRELYDRYGHEGVKAGGDPNPQPDFGAPQFHAGPPGFGFGFDSPFFASFGMPAHPQFQDQFAQHHQRHMRQMGSMFDGMFGADIPRHQQQFGHHGMFANDFFADPFQSFQQQTRPTLFSTSPFASQFSQTQQYDSGNGTSPFVGFTSSSSSSSSSSGGRGGIRTSTKTTVVNGKRTTITETTDSQGMTTTTVENPDGSRQLFVNGVPTAIEDATLPGIQAQGQHNSNGDAEQPIMIPDDENDHGGVKRTQESNGGFHRDNRGPSTRGDSSYSRRVDSYDARTLNNASSSASNPIVLDVDEDEDMYEDLSRYSHPRRSSAQSQSTRQDQNQDPSLFHPRMGHGQSKSAHHRKLSKE
ncbi:hypothetical protein BGZ98_009527 [Dissophora globulifera]|nr:hypothetical protein BGZ98_009527 [Dissophora globulifera]